MSLTDAEQTVNIPKQEPKNEVYVRPYRKEDIPVLVDTAVREIPKLPNYSRVQVDPEHLTWILTHNHGNDGHVMIRVLCESHEEKIIGGVMGHCSVGMLNKDRVCTDLFLFVMEQNRSMHNVMQLIEAYKAWAKARGAKIIQATQTGGYKTEALGRLLGGCGFKKVGEIYHLDERV